MHQQLTWLFILVNNWSGKSRFALWIRLIVNQVSPVPMSFIYIYSSYVLASVTYDASLSCLLAHPKLLTLYISFRVSTEAITGERIFSEYRYRRQLLNWPCDGIS
jgi:hypothetical protein